LGSVGGSSSEYKRTGRSGSIRFSEVARGDRLPLVGAAELRRGRNLNTFSGRLACSG
jgi:hypothetical protein